MLTISDLSPRIAGRLLIDNASLTLPAGTKAGLVGRNGAGKSTLFRVITGDLAPESGNGVPAEELPHRAGRPGGAGHRGAADRHRARSRPRAQRAHRRRPRRRPIPHRIAEIQTRLADIDAHSAEARAASILAGLGFDHEAQQRPASSFSGGWRMRVALAAVLFSRPDLLLLDEPTNYLDLEGTLWLEDYVRRYPYTVAHHQPRPRPAQQGGQTPSSISTRASSPSTAATSTSSSARGGADELQMKMRARTEAAKRKHMEAFVERFRYKASKARQAQSRLKALERMGSRRGRHRGSCAGASPSRGRKSRWLRRSSRWRALGRLRARQAGPAPAGPRLDDDDRIALLGANGNGKSTFAKLIAGRLAPEERAHADARRT